MTKQVVAKFMVFEKKQQNCFPRIGGVQIKEKLKFTLVSLSGQMIL